MKRKAAGVVAGIALLFGAPASAGDNAGGNGGWRTPPAAAAGVPVILLYDMNARQVLAERQADLPFVPASMTKAMTAQVAFGLLASGRLDARQTFTVSPAIAQEWNGKGTSLYLRAGEAVPVDVLLRAITTVSANDAAIVLASNVAGTPRQWAGLMNAEAQRIGMKHSHFASPNGWPDGGQTYVTARDLAVLAEAMIRQHPEYYHRYIGQKSLGWNGVVQTNRDPLLDVVAGADGIKTGHTREAGFNFLGSAERDGRRLILVVAGARSEAERASASRALLEWGYAAWRARPLFRAGARIGQARVQGGALRQVPLRAVQPVAVALGQGENPAIRLEIRYKGPLVAPIARGTQVASLVVRIDGREVSRVPLEAAQAVAVAGPLDRLRNGLYGLIP